VRNLLATLILSQGTPMICAGDEFGRTQNGNNNAYCQDNATSWLDWRMDEERMSLVNFFRRLTAAFHLYPVLRRSRFLTGEMNPAIEVKDVSWIDATGSEMTAEAWDNGTRCFGMLLDGRGQATGIKRRGADVSLLIVFNAHHDTIRFTLPRCCGTQGWKRLFDTADPQLAATQADIGAVYDVSARSVLLFERIPERTDRRAAK
jgi:glycogen operon protein